MSNENKSIHEFDFNLICEYFSGVERQGPGSAEMTVKALSFTENLNNESLIADLGCGTGSQTITLALNAPGQITAIDLFPAFIDRLNQHAEKLNLQDRIRGMAGSMDNLPFQEASLDLIWSEGAIYNIGFEKGLKYWKKFLKTGGYVAVTEASWFTGSRPAEIENFWMDAYPEIDTIPNKVACIQESGYLPVAAFILPEYCWTKNFYVPQAAAQKDFLKKHKGNAMAASLIRNEMHEARLYDKYKAFYGYVFYIGKKI